MAIEQYRQYIRHLLLERRERASRQRNAPEYEVQTVFDAEQDHYQLLYVGCVEINAILAVFCILTSRVEKSGFSMTVRK